MPDREILEDLFFIERGYLNGNHFVCRSKSPVLIDTGYVSGFDETERRITDLGVNLSDISLIINTHTHWFKETVDFYFSSDYESTYSDIVNPFIQKGIVTRENGRLSTTVKP